MKHIRQAKNTRMKGKMPDEFVTEHIDETLFNSKHEAMGGWEKVSNAKCKELCDANEQLMKDWIANKDYEGRLAKKQANAIKLAEIKAKELAEADDRAEFEAFKAWKESQGN